MLQIQNFTCNPFQENTYLLYNELGNAILIDPGMYFNAEKERFENEVVKSDLKIKKIINTHCHIDHIFSVEWAHQKYDLPLYLHKGEEFLLVNGKAMGEKYGLEFEPYSGRINYLKEGDVVTLDNDELKIIEAAGHSPASICLYCSKQDFIIAGDVLFRDSIGRTDLPGGNHELLIRNIQTKLFVLPDDTRVYPGHGVVTTIGYEKRNNPFVKNVG